MIAWSTEDPINAMSQAELENVIESWPDDIQRPPITPAKEIGALRQWLAEVGAGVRTTLTRDPLYLAAIAEAQGRDAIKAGLPELAYSYRRHAAAIVLDAAQQKRKAS